MLHEIAERAELLQQSISHETMARILAEISMTVNVDASPGISWRMFESRVVELVKGSEKEAQRMRLLRENQRLIDGR